jgi:predicted dinucleotide-binding enzyme
VTTYDIAVIGGTGPQGKGLAYRWAKHGHLVVLGSRSAERADTAAAEIRNRLADLHDTGGAEVSGATNADAAAALVPGARLVGAFHHVSAVTLWGDQEYLDHEDVLVCGDDQDAKAVAIELARAVTSRAGVDAGRLRLARQLEPWTAVLISINKRYKTRSGTSISGIPRDA